MKTMNRRIVSVMLLKFWRFLVTQVLMIVTVIVLSSNCFALEKPLKVVFEGKISEHKWALKDLKPELPTDWTGYNYLVMEMRASTPQRFSMWIYTAKGNRRLMLQPFGQSVWLRACIPLQYFKGKDKRGTDLASTNNRRTDSFWMSVWGPFGDLNEIEALGFTMKYPVDKPTLEIRSLELAKEDPGSKFLEKTPVLDKFGQWAHADWPRKIKTKEQLQKELADEEKTLHPGDFKYCEYGGYLNTKAKATGFFRIEQIDGKWWFVDPHGHLFLSLGSNGIRSGRGRRDRNRSADDSNAGFDLLAKRLESWGFNTIGNWSDLRLWQNQRKAYVTTFRSSRTGLRYLGMPDVYSDEFARSIDSSASQQCTPRKNDPWLIGYFIGNEPPWPGRESELVDMFLNGPETATKTKLKAFLAQGDTPERREEFVHAMFEKYLELICTAIRKYDSNHLNLGIRFGGNPPEEVAKTGRVFDVCSINVYEYEPTEQINRIYKLTGRPILIGEFHIGVPANGLGAGLVQARDQKERGKGYRYYVEQAAALPCFLGAHWFTWRDEPVLGRMDGENYNIGFVDVINRPYPELVDASKATHKRLFDIHSGKVAPFSQRPKASDAGTPNSPWD